MKEYYSEIKWYFCDIIRTLLVKNRPCKILVMKKVILLCLCAFWAMAASAQAVIKFEKVSYDFGTFPETKQQSAVFTFTNTGDKPLIIQQAFSSCGCTVANFTKDPVKPGEKGQVSVTYNGKGKMPGPFKKAITIRSNASNSLARVYIEGTMEESK